MPVPSANLFGTSQICAVVAASTTAAAMDQFRTAVGPANRSRTIELRLDYLHDATQRTALLGWISRQRRLPLLIATCRTRRSGGEFEGDAEAELAILASAVAAGCAWCDVAIETAEQFEPGELRRALAPARLLISAHDFRYLPRELKGLVERLERCRADAIKIAAVCHSLAGARRLLALTHGRRDLVAIPMGEGALAARVLALKEGSALAYAAVAQTTAPGQLTIDTAKSVYHLDRQFGRPTSARTRQKQALGRLSRHTRVYGVIADPVAHSLSPLMHNTAFAARSVNAIYLPFQVRDLRDFLAAIKPFGIAGFSVTIPHKQRILRHLDRCDELATAIGAVNTVVVRGGGLYGYNTDYAGVLRAIENRVSLPSSRVLLMGAGGAARAVAFALARGGAKVAICARRAPQAYALARAAGGEAIKRAAVRREFFDAIVNCTPVGMHNPSGDEQVSPLDASELNCRLVMDLIYRPRQTALLRLARSRGIETISGVEMFVGQGVAQWEIWMGERAPEGAMRRAVIEALDAEERAAARPLNEQ